MTTNKRVGIFFGSTTCYTEMAGEKIQAALQQTLEQAVDLFDIKDTPLAKFMVFLLGILVSCKKIGNLHGKTLQSLD
jgi:flavodoxin